MDEASEENGNSENPSSAGNLCNSDDEDLTKPVFSTYPNIQTSLAVQNDSDTLTKQYTDAITMMKNLYKTLKAQERVEREIFDIETECYFNVINDSQDVISGIDLILLYANLQEVIAKKVLITSELDNQNVQNVLKNARDGREKLQLERIIDLISSMQQRFESTETERRNLHTKLREIKKKSSLLANGREADTREYPVTTNKSASVAQKRNDTSPPAVPIKKLKVYQERDTDRAESDFNRSSTSQGNLTQPSTSQANLSPQPPTSTTNFIQLSTSETNLSPPPSTSPTNLTEPSTFGGDLSKFPTFQEPGLQVPKITTQRNGRHTVTSALEKEKSPSSYPIGENAADQFDTENSSRSAKVSPENQVVIEADPASPVRSQFPAHGPKPDFKRPSTSQANSSQVSTSQTNLTQPSTSKANLLPQSSTIEANVSPQPSTYQTNLTQPSTSKGNFLLQSSTSPTNLTQSSMFGGNLSQFPTFQEPGLQVPTIDTRKSNSWHTPVTPMSQKEQTVPTHRRQRRWRGRRRCPTDGNAADQLHTDNSSRSATVSPENPTAIMRDPVSLVNPQFECKPPVEVLLDIRRSGGNTETPAVPPRNAERPANVQPQHSRGLTGLQNPGGYSYINCVIQCVSNTPSLAKFCRNVEQKKNSFTEKFAHVIKNLWTSKHQMVSAEQLKAAFELSEPTRVDATRAENPSKFLKFLLETLRNDFRNSSLAPISDATVERKTPIFNLFFGIMKTTTTCEICKHADVEYNDFTSITLPVPHSDIGALFKGNPRYKLRVMLDDFFEEDRIAHFTCLQCGVLCNASKKMSLAKLPPIVVLQVERFKDDKPTNFSLLKYTFDRLDLKQYLDSHPNRISDDESHHYNYRLYAMCGFNELSKSDCFFAKCQTPTQLRWHTFQDELVTEISTKRVTEHMAGCCLLFYRSFPDDAESSCKTDR